MIEFLLVLAPGILSMLVWRRRHKEQRFSALDYLEGVAAFDFAVLLINVFLIWSRGWEEFDLTDLGSLGLLKYVITSVIFSVGLPFLLEALIRSKSGDGTLADDSP